MRQQKCHLQLVHCFIIIGPSKYAILVDSDLYIFIRGIVDINFLSQKTRPCSVYVKHLRHGHTV